MDGRKSIVVAQLVINFVIAVALALFPIHAEKVYIRNYIVDAGCALIVIILYENYARRNGFDVFDPIFLITVLYGFMYFVTPIYDILIEKYTWFGYYLFPYGVKASLIALLGYGSFYLSYTTTTSGATGRITPQRNLEQQETGDFHQNDMIVVAILLFYACSFAANLYYLLHSGYGNILYILTMGFAGSGKSGFEQQESIGFIAMFSYCLPTLVLLYWEYGRNKVLTAVLLALMVMMQVTRGFRFLVVQIVISFACYFYLTKKKRPRLRHIALLLLILMIPVLLMTMFRDGVRSGEGAALSGITGASIRKAIDDAVWDNFRIYNNFYGMIHSIPNTYGYVYGRQILIGTLVMVIPRAIWPNKISTKAGVDLDLIIGSRLAHTGQAYPGIGEYYYAFGIVGVIICMALYGVWMRRCKKRYMENSTGGLDIITYSVLLASNLQIIIRGYTPSNFWYVIFSLLPVLLVKILRKNEKYQ